MQVGVRQIAGNWDDGYVLSKHTISSTYLGDDDNGHPKFDTLRSKAGEALYQLKYRQDWNQVAPLAADLASHVWPLFDRIDLIVPMPASTQRNRQPVRELAWALAALVNVKASDTLLTKAPTTQLKNVATKEEKAAILAGQFTVTDVIPGNAGHNVLLLDDLFHTGASMEAACTALRGYPKIDRIYVAAVTWK
jgi:predicted amidophosphoribosyltransferase